MRLKWAGDCAPRGKLLAIESLIPIFRIDLIWSRGRLLSRMCPCLCTRWLLLFPRGQPSSVRVCLGAGEEARITPSLAWGAG